MEKTEEMNVEENDGAQEGQLWDVVSLARSLTLSILFDPEVDFCIYEIVRIAIFIPVAPGKVFCDRLCER